MSKVRRAMAWMLTAALVCQPGMSARAEGAQWFHTKEKPAKPGELDGERRVLHLLSRLSFGATPELVAEVKNEGIYRWFEEQLEPEEIDDTALESRLKAYPAMDLMPDELLTRFPTGNILRQVADGKLGLPADRELALVYRHRLEVMAEKQEKKAEKQAAAPVSAGGDAAAAPGAMVAEKAAGAAAAAAQEAKPVAVPTITKMGEAEARPGYEELVAKELLALKPGERVDRILRMRGQEYEELRKRLKGPQVAQLMEGLTPEQLELVEAYDNPRRTVEEELAGQRLVRAIYSKRQLQEVMTAFWMNHFNVYAKKNEEAPYLISSYEREIVRPLALGNFEELLMAVAHSPAMLTYLDNATSTGPDSRAAEAHKRRQAEGKEQPGTALPGLNENYARELMELHTLGVNGGYTQADVTEVAKILTGWTVDHPALGGGFEFDGTRHEPGEKVVMGHRFKEEGEKEGLKLLHMLATSKATARFISTKLAVAFVSDAPPETLVKRMAASFEDNDGDISAVLRTMVHSPEFWAEGEWRGKVKSPLEYVVSAARATGAEVTNAQPLVNQLNQMGMPLYGAMPPTGYAAKSEDWVSTGALVARMNFAMQLAGNRLGKIQVDLPVAPGDVTAAEAALEARLVLGGVSEKTRDAALAEVGSQFPAPVKPLNEKVQAAREMQERAVLAGMLLGSPEFQRR